MRNHYAAIDVKNTTIGVIILLSSIECLYNDHIIYTKCIIKILLNVFNR